MRRSIYFVALAFALSVAACSDDETKTPAPDMGVDKGTTPTPDKGTTPTPDKGTTPTPDKGTTEDGTAPGGACTNADDAAELDTKEERDAITAQATNCGMGCLADADPAACSTACMTDKTNLSAECAGCYVGILMCTMQNCLADCVPDSSKPECGQCMQDKGCYPAFYTCSGLPEAQPDGGA